MGRAEYEWNWHGVSPRWHMLACLHTYTYLGGDNGILNDEDETGILN